MKSPAAEEKTAAAKPAQKAEKKAETAAKAETLAKAEAPAMTAKAEEKQTAEARAEEKSKAPAKEAKAQAVKEEAKKEQKAPEQKTAEPKEQEKAAKETKEKAAAKPAASRTAPAKAEGTKAEEGKGTAERAVKNEEPKAQAAEKTEKPERKAAVSQDNTSRPAPRQSRETTRGETRDTRTGFRQDRTQDRRDGTRTGTQQGRPPRQNDGTRPPRNQDGPNRFGNRTQDGRSSDSRPRFTPGQGRPSAPGRGSDGQRTEGHGGEGGRFGGAQAGRGQGAKPGARRGGQDGGFTRELSKTTKDSKRERDRENKNKKKDFDKPASQGKRPNQNQTKQSPKPLQKPQAQPRQEEKKPEIKEIIIPEKLTIRELADAMKMQPSVIVKKLFMQGIIATVNQEIDFEKAEEIALEYDIIAEKEEKVDVIEELLKEDEEDESKMVPRPPVVCVMGHVDHGKTSLLDAIRNTNVTRGEAGGITQHIGAYVVNINGERITFLDTPGHEAFTAMRMRGANATDIAVLVVAADDGVMPQTIEAISHAKAAGVEIIVAINKIDKPSANIERVKQELSEYELLPEDWGGSTVFVPVSAKTGEGIDTLLEMILLTSEVLELKADPDRAARGLVIEAQLDKGKGPVATILVQKGTLHVGDFIAAGACSGKVRAMMDDKGRRVKEALPSTPVEILGLGDVPNAGEVLMAFASDKEAKNFAGAFVSENKNRLLEETKGKLSLDNLFDQIQQSDLKELPIVVKADVQGSVEAVKQSLLKLSNDEVVVKVIHGGVGAINESDVSLAATTNAIIIGFNVRPDSTAKQLAEQEKVDMRLYKVIYQAIEDVEAAMKGMLDPIYEEKVIGHAQVRQIFKASGVGTIAGSYVTDGVFQRNCKVRISREGEQIFEGELASLKRFKDDVKEVKTGFECGLVIDGFNDLKEDDLIEAYIMVEVPR